MSEANIMPGPAPRSSDDVDTAMFKARFVDVPKVVLDLARDHLPMHKLDVLDFGCGTGSSALALALDPAVARVVGVDIAPAFEGCSLDAKDRVGLPGLPPNLHFHQVEPGQLHDPDDRFDLIYTWSVLERIGEDRLADTIAMLRRALKTGGVLIVVATPL